MYKSLFRQTILILLQYFLNYPIWKVSSHKKHQKTIRESLSPLTRLFYFRTMDTSGVATTPWKTRKTVNYDLCVICQNFSKAYSVVKQPKLDSVNKFLESCKIRHESHDSSVTDLFDIIGTITAPEFIDKHFVDHRECHNRLTNIKTIEQVVKRYEAAIIINLFKVDQLHIYI